MAERRQLKFDSLADVVRDAEHLLANGYDKAGIWDLAQCANHLAYWLTCPIDGFGKAPAPVRMFLWIARNTFGPGKLKKYIAENTFPPGAPTDPNSVKPAGGDAEEAVAKLKTAVARFEAYDGPIVPSPFFGPMDKDTNRKLQQVHCAHHLSFLVPKANGTA